MGKLTFNIDDTVRAYLGPMGKDTVSPIVELGRVMAVEFWNIADDSRKVTSLRKEAIQYAEDPGVSGVRYYVATPEGKLLGWFGAHELEEVDPSEVSFSWDTWITSK